MNSIKVIFGILNMILDIFWLFLKKNKNLEKKQKKNIKNVFFRFFSRKKTLLEKKRFFSNSMCHTCAPHLFPQIQTSNQLRPAEYLSGPSQLNCDKSSTKITPGYAPYSLRQTDIFFIVVLGLGEVNKHAKKILGRSEKKTYGNHYGNICPEFFGHIKTNDPLTNR